MFAGQLLTGSHLGTAFSRVASSLGKQSHSGDPDLRASPVSEPAWGLYADGVRLIALRALGDTSLADDIAQEAITRAIASLAADRGKPIADLGGFVYGIARHLITDVHRARGRTVSVDSVPEPTAPLPGALDLAIEEEDRHRLRSALSELDATDRNLLRLFFVDGLGAEEIGRQLNEPPVNIRKRKSRALARLRRVFERHETHPEPTDSR